MIIGRSVQPPVVENGTVAMKSANEVPRASGLAAEECSGRVQLQAAESLSMRKRRTFLQFRPSHRVLEIRNGNRKRRVAALATVM